MNTYEGRCGCGLITYSISDHPVNIINCHCNMCKNHNGSAFSTYAIFLAKSFKITHGDELLSEYNANDGVKKFCRQCGTPLFNTHDKYPNVHMVYIGTLNSFEGLEPRANAWNENRLTWVSRVSDMENLPHN